MESPQQEVDGDPQPRPSTDVPTDRTTRQTKRLSLNVPILSPTAIPERRNSPSPGYSNAAHSSGRSSPVKVVPAQPSPVDSTGFLTSLAAQERRVLELREELLRAEIELTKLKKQWAHYEASKKRSEVHRIEKLQQVTRPIDGIIAEEDGPLQEQENRRIDKPARKSQQRVFSGSRHTRTLSLLPPSASSAKASGPTSLGGKVVQPTAQEIAPGEPLQRSATQDSSELENTTFAKTYRELASRHSLPPPTKDAILRSGKQMASDLKEGFWTFFEDIRQATVGEEGINATENRSSLMQAQSGRPGLRPASSTGNTMKRTKSKDLLSKGSALSSSGPAQVKNSSEKASSSKSNDSFWGEFGLETPDQKRPQNQPLRQAGGVGPQLSTSHQPLKPGENAEDDHWDLWDSPTSNPMHTPSNDPRKAAIRHSGSTVDSHGAPESYAPSGTGSHGSSRTSTR